MNVMPISEIIEKVTMICKKNNVKRLDLFGSFATGTATPTSDIDFVVYGCDNLMQLEDDLLQIETLVIWGRCFWLFYCPRWQKKETEWISPLDFSDFTVCFCPFHFWCSIASYSRTFFHLKLLKYQICCSTCAPN